MRTDAFAAAHACQASRKSAKMLPPVSPTGAGGTASRQAKPPMMVMGIMTVMPSRMAARYFCCEIFMPMGTMVRSMTAWNLSMMDCFGAVASLMVDLPSSRYCKRCGRTAST